MRKAQIISFDLLFSAILFISVLLAAQQASRGVALHNAQAHLQLELESRAFMTSSLLLSSPGIPENWISSNVNTIGLSIEQNTIDVLKFSQLSSMNSSQITLLLGVSEYNIYLEIQAQNGTKIASAGALPVNATGAATFTSFAIYNNTIVRFNTMLWVRS